MLKTKVQKTITDHALFDYGATVMVALSGGADSVSLLRVLVDLGYECCALHCNFHLRGDESDRDEAFVTGLCAGLGIACHVKHFDTAGYAQAKRLSIEMAAREQRYQWFDECIASGQGTVVAVAHNADDNVETLLINLTRGCGLHGLTGIPYKNRHIVRPLLDAGRDEITAYLGHTGQDYVTDSTNLEEQFVRNRFRLGIIPMLRQINPSVKTSINETIGRLREAAIIYDEAVAAKVARIKDGNRISIEALRKEKAQTTLLHTMLHPLGFNPRQTEDIMRAINAQPGKTFTAGDWQVTRDRAHFIISRRQTGDEGTITLEDITAYTQGTLRLSHCTAEEALQNAKSQKDTAYIDCRHINGKLRLRKWHKGDWMIPYGMHGRKNISDLLTDLKKDPVAKAETYVITDDKNIIWVVDERIDERYKVSPATRNVLKIVHETTNTNNK